MIFPPLKAILAENKKNVSADEPPWVEERVWVVLARTRVRVMLRRLLEFPAPAKCEAGEKDERERCLHLCGFQ